MEPIWTPSQQQIRQSNMMRFIAFINKTHCLDIRNYQQLHHFSVQHMDLFWQAIIEFCGVKHSSAMNYQVKTDAEHMIETEWFKGMQLNFAENLLKGDETDQVILFESERGDKLSFTRAELYQEVSKVQQQLLQLGVSSGDTVAGFLPNIPHSIIAMLATVSLGAIWSSTSPDFGINGVIDRFGQIKPKVLFVTDGYYYNGKTFDCLEKTQSIVNQLTTLQRTVVIPFVSKSEKTMDKSSLNGITDAVYWDHWLETSKPQKRIDFRQVDFDHPLYILYSSGTTGQPKCIVHRAGGILLQHLKELVLHSDVKKDSRLFYFTTCGWMMWNWMVSTLATGAQLVLYDGSPFYPDGNRLFDLIDNHGITHFGSSAKWLAAVEKAGIKAKQSHQLKTLKTIFSTGSPLLPEQYDFVYNEIKSEVALASISGGTDICSCFALGNPILPVYKGQLQCIGLGLDVQVLDDNAQPVIGKPGELCCLQPFPVMPVYFWNDTNNEKYMSAYFSQFDNIWCHSDRAEITEQNGMIIYGRSDTTLNPGGVRIGTAEIYRQVEKIPEITDSVVISQDWKDDVRIVLFVVLQPHTKLDETLVTHIQQTIRQNTSPRHVPAVILQVPEVPRTLSGKVVELAVRHVVHNQPVKNTDALANPESLAYYKDLSELAS